jgi:hypothetical protein
MKKPWSKVVSADKGIHGIVYKISRLPRCSLCGRAKKRKQKTYPVLKERKEEKRNVHKRKNAYKVYTSVIMIVVCILNH